MVEIFKTNVHHEHQAMMLMGALSESFPAYKINFDLEDCDRVLRVEGPYIAHADIISLMGGYGYQCETML